MAFQTYLPQPKVYRCVWQDQRNRILSDNLQGLRLLIWYQIIFMLPQTIIFSIFCANMENEKSLYCTYL